MTWARLRFLEAGEEAILPGWAKWLPVRFRYAERHRPYRIQREGGETIGILQTEKEGAVAPGWRQGASALLTALQQEGVSIVVPPVEGEFPREVLPFAEGRRLATLFAFAGAAEALRRLGKEPAEGRFLLAGGEPGLWRAALASMGAEGNHLAIFTDVPEQAEPLLQELYAERGLLAEVFSSAKNPAFREADAVLSCGMEQRAFEHILKKEAVWMDLAGNRPMLRRLQQLRPDIIAAEGFFFHVGEKQMEGRIAEAEAYLSCPIFRQCWEQAWSQTKPESVLAALQESGIAVSGFSAFGKRVKVRRG